MKRKIILVIACAAVLLLAGCGPDDLSLFPLFLTSVTHIRDLSGYFSNESSTFFLSAIETDGSDHVYIVQALSDGYRKLAVFNNYFDEISIATSRDFGSMHSRLDLTNHLIGLQIFNHQTYNFIPSMLSPENARDRFILNDGTNYHLLYATDFDGTSTILNSHEYSYSSVFSGGTQINFPVGEQYRHYVVEAARTTNNPEMIIVFRDFQTGKGYISKGWPPPVTPLPPNWIPLEAGGIAAGTVDITDYGDIIAQTYDGYLTIFNSFDGRYYNRMPVASLSNYLIAYGMNDVMYLFNPGTRQLFKSRAWWRDYYGG